MTNRSSSTAQVNLQVPCTDLLDGMPTPAGAGMVVLATSSFVTAAFCRDGFKFDFACGLGAKSAKMLRMLRLLRFLQGVVELLKAVYLSLPSLINVVSLLFLLLILLLLLLFPLMAFR